ncbi:GNAT family N-acetyltransferase [Lysobacter sp. Root690]|uniref:GNAT family N-acetyltransferase n=1 Tax=Lysobacter sp. Root690 TaxID=1736588 RepID=UPI0006FF58CF|nr:GNAT family N-acetyltransferase [Lysobacter sp. Root690]KRB10917.1 acetyltransferase [Lysobacter sp. Root690]
MTSETPQFSIRRAVVADAATVADIAARTFVETFGDLYPPEDLAFFLKDSYSVEKQAVILSHPDYAIFLLERDGIVVGHAAAGPCGLPHPQVAPGDGELKRLYVLREAQNGGWGARLFDTVLAWLEREGPRTLWIGVWSENFGAQRFYGRYGFEKAGEYEFIVGGTRDHEFILRRNAVR